MRAGLDLFEIGLELGLGLLPVDAELLQQLFEGRGVPVELRKLVGMGAERQRRELAVGHDRQRVDLVDRLADPLVLVERGDAAGVVADHHVGLGFLDRDLDLAVDGEGAGELALADDVAEAEAAAVVPGGIVDHLGAERLQQAGGDGDAVAVHHGVVVDHVLRHHLVDVAGRMDGGADAGDVDLSGAPGCARASHAATRSSGRSPPG